MCARARVFVLCVCDCVYVVVVEAKGAYHGLIMKEDKLGRVVMIMRGW